MAALSAVALGCSTATNETDGGLSPTHDDAGRTDVVDERTADPDVADTRTPDGNAPDSDATAGDTRLDVSDATTDGDAPTDVSDGRSDGDAACNVGQNCGVDCSGPEQAPCWACGSLYYTSNCECRAMAGAGACIWPDCRTPAVGQEGDYCGTYWWCDRPCAAGLACEPFNTDARWADWMRTCQRIDAGAADVAPDGDASSCDATNEAGTCEQ